MYQRGVQTFIKCSVWWFLFLNSCNFMVQPPPCFILREQNEQPVICTHNIKKLFSVEMTSYLHVNSYYLKAWHQNSTLSQIIRMPTSNQHEDRVENQCIILVICDRLPVFFWITKLNLSLFFSKRFFKLNAYLSNYRQTPKQNIYLTQINSDLVYWRCSRPFVRK